jgi:transglutaminase-like putative cysteine protease
MNSLILEIEHIFKYEYDNMVRLNPHYFYLSPHLFSNQRLISHELEIFPKPDLLVPNIDQEDNTQHIVYINQSTRSFQVKSSVKVASDTINMLNFVFYPFETAKLPFKYPARLATYVGQALKIRSSKSPVKEYARALAERAHYDTVDFLMLLTESIRKDFLYEIREIGEAQTASETLALGKGSCRDFAVFMMECCGSIGLLSRFVSGYFVHGNSEPVHLHAWIEVLLPGGGWRGFDPTEGIAVDQRYLALAKSLEPKGLVPIRGTFRALGKVEVNFKVNLKADILSQ